jgi:hypothetical protein
MAPKIAGKQRRGKSEPNSWLHLPSKKRSGYNAYTYKNIIYTEKKEKKKKGGGDVGLSRERELEKEEKTAELARRSLHKPKVSSFLGVPITSSPIIATKTRYPLAHSSSRTIGGIAEDRGDVRAPVWKATSVKTTKPFGNLPPDLLIGLKTRCTLQLVPSKSR